MAVMRTFTRLGVVLASVTATLLAVAGTAMAGGPTSVMLASPSNHSTTALYYTDDAYQRLEDLVVQEPTAEPGAPDLHGTPGTDDIRLTWLIHDVQVWRIDHVFTNIKGEVWIETVTAKDGNPPKFDTAGIVHRSKDPAALMALLSGLKLFGEGPPPRNFFSGTETSAAAAPNQATASAPVSSPVAGPNWWWILIGIAVGATFVAGFRPVVRRLRAN
jgi:hypothetical protein